MGNVLATKFRAYVDAPAIVFEQVALQDIKPGGASRENVSTIFPAFQLPQAPGSLGVMQWHDSFLDGGSSGPAWTKWDTSCSITTGLPGGPMVLFDETAASALVFSPASNFMATNFAQFGGAVHAGLMGSFEVIPAGFTSASVLWYGSSGINPTIMAWGAALLAMYGKTAAAPSTDFTAQYLTYNTDHGM